MLNLFFCFLFEINKYIFSESLFCFVEFSFIINDLLSSSIAMNSKLDFLRIFFFFVASNYFVCFNASTFRQYIIINLICIDRFNYSFAVLHLVAQWLLALSWKAHANLNLAIISVEKGWKNWSSNFFYNILLLKK